MDGGLILLIVAAIFGMSFGAGGLYFLSGYLFLWLIHIGLMYYDGRAVKPQWIANQAVRNYSKQVEPRLHVKWSREKFRFVLWESSYFEEHIRHSFKIPE